MNFTKDPFYTFDDVLLVPQFSEINSRSLVDTSVDLLPGIHLRTPIISANMDSITECGMAIAMHAAGGLGILHRFATVGEICGWIDNCAAWNINAIPSVGIHQSDREYARAYREKGCATICLDIAHGDSRAAINMTKFLKEELGFQVIAGNVATRSGAAHLASAGADVVKVGVGNGSVCQTRIVTGHGFPQLSAIMNCKRYLKDYAPTVKIIADGGIRNSGDIVKAIAAGADAVMVGGVLAGCNECPIKGSYRGMASTDAAQKRGHAPGDYHAPEGISVEVAARGPVSKIIAELTGGLRSGCSYSGAVDLKELYENAEFIVISHSSLRESHPHFRESFND